MDIFSAAEKNVYSFIYPLESIIRIPGLHYYRLYREVRHPARHPIKAAVLSFNVIASHQNKLDSVEILKITTFTRIQLSESRDKGFFMRIEKVVKLKRNLLYESLFLFTSVLSDYATQQLSD